MQTTTSQITKLRIWFIKNISSNFCSNFSFENQTQLWVWLLLRLKLFVNLDYSHLKKKKKHVDLNSKSTHTWIIIQFQGIFKIKIKSNPGFYFNSKTQNSIITWSY